ncbi:Actin- protein 6 [Coemansia javaensis]|uniref:Actin-like protein ARP6 n=1 Tax=Coemansia javaensis TaxID=2761396 RepID=A0A9W8HHQ4_9FUNG|nr:Actin- protein 6 [Coemansia javaensis]
MPTLVLDNGSHAIKCGYADDVGGPRTVPNTTARSRRTRRVYVGDEIDASEGSGLYYRSPFERGYLVGWDSEALVWDRVLGPAVLGCTPAETDLAVSEPVFNFAQIQRTLDEVVFEEYRFASLLRAPAPRLAAELVADEAECLLVVDAGHAATHAVPYHGLRQQSVGVRRVDVGGRMLTSYLKETVSFRYWDMMDEPYIMADVKEKCCFVSQDFGRDLDAARADRRGVGLDYVLPDLATHRRGFVREPGAAAAGAAAGAQVLPLGNERFAVPEALFHPSDVGLAQGGVHHAVAQAIAACDEALRPVLCANVVLVGGSAALPGLRERLEREVQALVPHRVRVAAPDAPAACAWRGACALAARPAAAARWRVARAQYDELGPDRTAAHFAALV